MKIIVLLHQFRNPSAGGTEVYGSALARALRRHGHDVRVVSVERDGAKPDYRWSDDTVDGLPVRFLNIPAAERTGFDSYHDDPVTDLRMSELIQVERPDVIHILHLTGLSTGWLERLPPGPRVILTLADHWLYCARGQLLDSNLNLCTGPEASKCAGCLGFSHSFGLKPQRWESGTARIDNRWLKISGALRRVDTFVSPSRDTGERHVAAGLVPPDRLVVQDYGFETLSEKPTRDPGRRKTIGYLGTLMYSKGVHVLLEAFSAQPPDGIELHLMGAWADYHGQGGYRDRCRKWLSGGRVKELGPVPHADVPERLAGIDLLVVPSIWPENSPLVVHEALLMGVPVVASDTGGLRELIVPGENGYLVEPGDAGDLARTLSGWAAGQLSISGLEKPGGWVRAIDEDVAALEKIYGEARRAA